jgi:hypothetical protein
MRTNGSRLLRLVRLASCCAVLLGVSGVTSVCLAQAHRPVQRVPAGTRMKIRLDDTIDAKEGRRGDKFKATVLTPHKYEEARIDGHLQSVKRSGKFEGRTAILLVFDRIRYRNGTVAPLHAQVERVYGEENVERVDEEGNVESGKRGTQTKKRVGGGAIAGAVIGGLAGGGKGAAIGAVVGGAAGAGSLMIQGSKSLKLERGTEILILVSRR